MTIVAIRLMERTRNLINEYFGFKVSLHRNGSRNDTEPTAKSNSKLLLQTQAAEEGKHNEIYHQHVEISEGSQNNSGNKEIVKPKDPSCITISVYSAVVVGMICLFLVLGRDYIKYLLLSLEKTNFWISLVVFICLFTVVSFPMTWGYILLNIAAGYLYGWLIGVLVVMVCALTGITIAHFTIRRCLRNFVVARLSNDSVRSIMTVVDSDMGFKVVIWSRLTPIPFGLQNALFAISGIVTHRYLVGSVLGMMPTQSMHAYIGSTLRSMEEVISDSAHSITAYIIFGGQLLVAVLLLVFVVRRAKQEFNRMVMAAEPLSMTVEVAGAEEKVTIHDCAPVTRPPSPRMEHTRSGSASPTMSNMREHSPGLRS